MPMRRKQASSEAPLFAGICLPLLGRLCGPTKSGTVSLSPPAWTSSVNLKVSTYFGVTKQESALVEPLSA